MNTALNKYKSVSVESGLEGASPYEVTKKLFDGCYAFLKQARVAIENKDYEKKALFISKSEAIIATLASSLNHEANKEVSDNLVRLYDYCLTCLVDASVTMDVEKVDVVIKIISEIKGGWDSIPKDEIIKAESIRSQGEEV